jgi:Family of unknown function (DUF5686)/CarboxypepD_reg-like domain
MHKIYAVFNSCLLLFLLPVLSIAQVSGKVTDENGESLPYATVYVRNTSNGTATNASGFYKLQVGAGAQDIVFQYIGYKTKIEKITVANKPITLNVKLEPSDLELREVVVSSKDPAIAIMREVIAKRKFYKNKVNEYACDVYIKGFHKLIDAPKKIFGQEVGEEIMDDSTGSVLYLSESVSKLYYQTPPAKAKEIMVSSKVSGNDRGFSMNRATFTDFDLYSERIEIDREILSPLADNAFSYYNFKWAGSFKDINGYTIEKIKVIPKRAEDPTFSGFLYVVDSWWNLQSVDLVLTGASIKQPIIDTLRIQQQFVLVDKPDTWRVFNQITSFKVGILGFKINGFFNSVFSNYDLKPVFDDKFFGREVFKVEDSALKRDTNYWASIRPVPLTNEEQRDYIKKDSIQKIRTSKTYLDSMDRRNNRFEVMNLLTGYTWKNSYKNRSFSYPPAAQWIQFNTVQGMVFDVQPEWQRDADDRGTKYWRALGNLNYGLKETKLRGWLGIKRRFESIRYSTLEVIGGSMTEQFNEQRPIATITNTQYSLIAERNYMKLYDKTYAKVEWSQILAPGLSFVGFTEWARRKPLINRTTYSWRKGAESRYTPNAPIPALEGQEDFAAPDIFLLGVDLRYRIGQQYSTYPDIRYYGESKWPDFTLRYRKAIPKLLGGDADFDFVHLLIRQNNLNWGLGGYTDWSAGAGMFIRNKSVSFMDIYHPSGNQTIFGLPNRYSRSFLMLPYFAYATDKPFAEAHVQHHLEGYLLDKIPLLRKLNFKEVIGAGIFYADHASADPKFTGKLPYWELNAGFENIGIKALRPFRVDVVWGFFGKNHYRTGVVIGVSL